MNDLIKLKSQINSIVNHWNNFNLSDVGGIIELRQTLSVYYYNLSEYKADKEKAFLTYETQRKNVFNSAKISFIDEGKSATDSTTRAESTEAVQELRRKEVEYEREYKYARDILSSLDHILNAMSSAINQASNERKQSNYHT